MATKYVGDRQPKRGRSRFRGKIVGIILLGLASAVALGFGAVYYALVKKADATLAEAVDEADRLDPGWRMEEIEAARSRDVIPAEEDAGPRVIRIVDKMPLPAPSVIQSQMRPGISPLIQIDGALKNYPPFMVLGSDMHAAIAEEVRKHAEALKEARLLTELTRGRFPLTIAKIPFDTLLRNTQNSRSVAVLLRLDAILRTEKQDIDAALHEIRAMIGVSHSIGDEPFAISQLVRIAEDFVALETLDRVLAQGTGTDDALAKVQKRLQDETKIPFNLIAMRGERAVAYDLFGKLADGTVPLNALSGSVSDDVKFPGSLTPHARALYRFNQGLSLRMMNKAVEISKLPVAEQVEKWKSWEAEIKPPADTWGKMTQSLTFALIPALGAAATAHFRLNAMLGCAEVMVAMERFRIANGHWPETLDQIPKSILPEIPLDPYSGSPIKVKRDENSWIVYSVGPNGTDDGGTLDDRFDPKTEDSDWGYTLHDPSARRQPAFYEEQLPSQPFLGEPLLDGFTLTNPDMLMDMIR